MMLPQLPLIGYAVLETIQTSWMRLRFDYVTLLECGNCFARSHSFLFLKPNRGRQGGNGDYMIVWHEVFSIVHFLLAFKFHRPSCKLWVWIKFLITWAAISSKGFKGATMLLVVSFTSFFLFCHRKGQCIVPPLNWKDSFILSTNI